MSGYHIEWFKQHRVEKQNTVTKHQLNETIRPVAAVRDFNLADKHRFVAPVTKRASQKTEAVIAFASNEISTPVVSTSAVSNQRMERFTPTHSSLKAGHAQQTWRDAVAARDPFVEHSQSVALILAVFLGFIGVHRFYLGYPLEGIMIILLTLCCGIGIVWWIIDVIRIATGDLKPKRGDYDEVL